MAASILALATALPPHAFAQDEIAEKIIDIFSLDPLKAKSIRQLYKNSAISRRHTVIPDFKYDRTGWRFWGPDYPHQIPGMAQRNDVYKTEAPKLAFEAASKALNEWKGDPGSITHVISVSCTGVVAPGIEFDLIKLLNLRPDVQRLGINFMGCFGAFKGLSVADAFAKEDPRNRVLVVCTELCSLHFQAEQTTDNILANSLFSDGAAAAIVGAEAGGAESPLWTIHAKRSASVDDTADKMRWEAGNEGYVMKLSHTVPVILGRRIEGFVQTLLGPGIPIQECDWAVHPGGKSIIQAVEKALQLDECQTKCSWDILADYGNMSSATFLFVLKKLFETRSSKKWTIGIGFGPGLSVEGIVLRRPEP